MGGRGSMGGTRSTYRGDSTSLFRQGLQQGTDNSGNGGGGGGGKIRDTNRGNTDTGGIQNGGGNGNGGGSVTDTSTKVEETTTTVNDQPLPHDADFEALFQDSPEFEEFDDRFQAAHARDKDPDATQRAYDRAYKTALARWIGQQNITPAPGAAPKPETAPAAAKWHDKLKNNINNDSFTLADKKVNTEAVNRNYTTSRANRINCQRCTATYEMRARGKDVVANDVTVGWKNALYEPLTDSYTDTLPSFTEIANMWKNESGGRGSWYVPQDVDRATVVSKMEAEILSWGEGARGFVGVTWNSSSSHIFNVEVKDGRIVYVDTQPVKLAPGMNDVELVFDDNSWKSRIDPTMWQGVMRVDNLEPAPRVGTWMRDRKESEINAPKLRELWSEIDRRVALDPGDVNAIPDDFDLKMAFFYGWEATWKGVDRPENGDLREIAPRPIRNDPVMMQVFEMGLDWSEVPL